MPTPDEKVSAMPLASTAAGADLVYGVQGGTSVKFNMAQIRAYAGEVLILVVGDETTTITTGTAKLTFRMPHALTLNAVRASLATPSSSGAVSIDINESGVSVLSTLLTIDATEKTSTIAATPAVISDTSLADDAEMTIDITGAGSGS